LSVCDASREAAKECSPRRKPWVSATTCNQAPEGRKKLIPDVSLVVGYVVFLQERCKLLLEGMFVMMLFLLGDIFCDCGDIRLAHAEDAVSGLPGEFRIPFFVQPAR
jgi:hypothetical protein